MGIRLVGVLPNMLQQALDFLCNGSGAEYQDLSMRLRGPRVEFGHGSDRGAKLFDDRLSSAAALTHIAVLAALHTSVVGHVNENARATKAAQLRPGKGKQTFDDYKWRGLGLQRLARTSVDGKI